MLGLGGPARAESLKQVEKQLSRQLKGQALTLRHPVRGKKLRFSAEGKLLQGGGEAHWIIYAQIEVRKVQVKSGLARIEGFRVRPANIGSKQERIRFRRGEKIVIEIEMNSNPVNLTQAQQLLGTVFLTKDDLPSGAQFEQLAAYFGSKQTEEDRNAFEQFIEETSDPSRPVYKIESPITPPECVSCPDPAYPQRARQARREGVVVFWAIVNEQGRAEEIRVKESLGMGLDEQAVKAVQQWRFKPAMRNGKPLAVYMVIEINFHLYK
jgi:TonB family protein